MESIKKKITWTNCILVFEILVVLSLVIVLFKPNQEVTITATEFEKKELSFYNTDAESIVSSEILLTSGAYDMTVYYDSQMDANTDTNNVSDIVGYVYLESHRCPAALQSGTIALNDGENSKSQTVWVSYGAEISDLLVYIEYKGQGKLEVEKITLKECYVYRWTRLLAFVLLFTAVDLLYILFFTDKIKFFSNRKKELLILLGILVGSSIPIMGNMVYYGHDLDFHINRIVSLAIGLNNGQFPVRIYSDMLNGYGYVTPLFYGDIMLYIPAMLYNAKVPLGICYNIYILLNNILTMTFSYVCFKNIVKDKKYVLLGVFIYTLAPYRLINIYTRAAVGEFTAMTFLPLIVLGFWNIYTKEKWRINDYLPLIIGVSGVIQSHVISTVMVAVFAVIFCVAELKKTLELRRLICLIKTVILIVFVNMWFLIPMLDSMSMEIASKFRDGRMQEQGIFPVQWFSIIFPAVGESLKATTYNEMGYSVGLPIMMGVVTCFYLYINRSKLSENHITKATFVCCGMGIIALIFTSIFFPWDILAEKSQLISKYLCMIQFPWRYLSIATMLLSIATVSGYSLMESDIKIDISKKVVLGIIIVFALSINCYYQQFTNQSEAYSILSENNRNVFGIVNKEYLLKGSDVIKMRERTVISSDNVNVEEIEKTGARYTYKCVSQSNEVERIVFPILNYENYYVKGKNDERYDIYTGENNCIAIDLPANYEGKIEIEYKERDIWMVCNVISLITVIVMILMMVVQNKKGCRLYKCRENM